MSYSGQSTPRAAAGITSKGNVNMQYKGGQYSDHHGGAGSSMSGECEQPIYKGVLAHVMETCKRRGVTGFKDFSRMFRLYDTNKDKSIDIQELAIGLHRYGCDCSDNEIKCLFEAFDRDGSGHINMTELIRAVRPKLSPCRDRLVKKAFEKMDKTNDGVITVQDLVGTYSVEHHPKFKSGEWTKKQCFMEFLNSFQADSDEQDEKITKDEFTDYYVGVSANIDGDVYFDYMMRQTWKL